MSKPKLTKAVGRRFDEKFTDIPSGMPDDFALTTQEELKEFMAQEVHKAYRRGKAEGYVQAANQKADMNTKSIVDIE